MDSTTGTSIGTRWTWGEKVLWALPVADVYKGQNIPGQALTESQKYGTLELAKIENMRTQAEDLGAGKHVQSTDDLENVERELEAGGTEGPAKAAPEKKFGYVAVCAGAGLEAVFRDLSLIHI